MNPIQVVYQDEELIVIDKPKGYHVHPPEDGYPIPRDLICLYLVRNLIGQHVYPVHRIDVSTTGLLIFAKTSEMASVLCRQFAERKVHKTYWAVVRGFTPAGGSIEIPLESDSTETLLEACTQYKRLATMQLPHAVGKRFPTARYSLIQAMPVTGRYHQIRRHFQRLSHPLVGDGTHGDSRHNTFFREHLGLDGLCLRAQAIELAHPSTGQWLQLNAPPSERWTKIQGLFKAFDLPLERQ